MIDFDMDGVLDAIDLLNAFEVLSMTSKFGKEIHSLMEWFTAKNLRKTSGAASKKKEVMNITID